MSNHICCKQKVKRKYFGGRKYIFTGTPLNLYVLLFLSFNWFIFLLISIFVGRKLWIEELWRAVFQRATGEIFGERKRILHRVFVSLHRATKFFPKRRAKIVRVRNIAQLESEPLLGCVDSTRYSYMFITTSRSQNV